MATNESPSNHRFPAASAPDAELAGLELAASHKQHAIAALVTAANARKARGDATDDIEEAMDLERMTLAGYTRAAEKRRREIFGGRP